LQQKMQRPVPFELTQRTREALEARAKLAGLKSECFLFPSRVLASPPSALARIVHDWVGEIGLDPAA